MILARISTRMEGPSIHSPASGGRRCSGGQDRIRSYQRRKHKDEEGTDVMGKDGTARATLHAFAAAAHERFSSIHGERARRIGTRLLFRPDEACTRDGFCKLYIFLDVSRKERKQCIPYPFLAPRRWDHGRCNRGKGSSLCWSCLLLLPS